MGPRDSRPPRRDGPGFQDGPRQPRPPKPDIVHKDDHVLIVNKPAGIPVLRGASPTLCEMVDSLTGARRRRMRVANFIDDECSGAVLFVATRDTEDSPRDQTHPETSYVALVEGVFDESVTKSGETISAPVASSTGQGATPSTHMRVLDSGNGLTLLQLRARPDLQGQIREHLALIKHPVVGDQRHGCTRDDLHRVAIHAQQIRITHPEDDSAQRYKCQAPASFWTALGKEPPPDALPDREAQNEKEQGWDHVAGWYDSLIQDRGSDHHQRIILPGVLRLLAPQDGEKVLDVACGQGIVSEHIVHHANVERVLGVDVSDRLIEAARTRSTERTEFAVHDAQSLETLESEHAPFDAAVCVMALMNIEDLDSVMKGVSAQLKPGGRFVCVISHPAFRIMGASAWGWTFDERTTQPVQFRRIDRYMSTGSSPIVMNPGEVARGAPAVTTVTHHRPMSAYIMAGTEAGLTLAGCEEWVSDRQSEPGPRAQAENRARHEFPLFMALRFNKPLADS
ncbi:MAG: methyltransferase domain-containing protein [Phycisphaerales bacterium JB052]